MMYVFRATMSRVATLWRSGAAKESASMLQAATKEVEVNMAATDVKVKKVESGQERVCNWHGE